MIEIYNNAGTESYGCFDKLQSAGGVFANLAARGVQSVTVSSFHGRNLHRRALPHRQNAGTAARTDTGGIV